MSIYCSITKAKLDDLWEINQLLKKYSWVPITEEFLKEDSVALIAKAQGKVIGFIWAGVMANKSLAYIDYFTVDPDFVGQKVAKELAVAVRDQLKKRDVSEAIAVIAKDKHHDKSKHISLFEGMQVVHSDFTCLIGKV